MGPGHKLFWHRRPNSKAFPRASLGQDPDFLVRGLGLKASQQVVKRYAYLRLSRLEPYLFIGGSCYRTCVIWETMLIIYSGCILFYSTHRYTLLLENMVI